LQIIRGGMNMKKTINKKELVLKQRRTWNINPTTRIEDNGKIYNRSAEKLISQSEIEEEMNEIEKEPEIGIVENLSKD
jgi:hypothetical protein